MRMKTNVSNEKYREFYMMFINAIDGTFAEKEIVDDQGNQTSIFRFCMQQTNGSLPFPFSVCSNQTDFPLFPFSRIPETWRQEDRDMEIWRHRDTEIETYKYGDIDMRHGNMEKWRHGDMGMETSRHGDMDMETSAWTSRHRILKNQMENGSLGYFP
jgi:hypothetical protein